MRVPIQLSVFILAAIVLCSCAGSKAESGEQATVSGTVVMIGNEPFATLAISTANGETFRLESDSMTLKKISEIQGQKIEATGLVRKRADGLILKIQKFVVQ